MSARQEPDGPAHDGRMELHGPASAGSQPEQVYMDPIPPKPSEDLSARGYELLVKAVVDYAIYMVSVEGRIVSWNAGAERIKGYSAEQAIGQHLSMFFTEEDRAAGRPAHLLATALATGRAQDEGWRVRRDGTRFWALAVMDLVHDEEGRVIGLAKITRDMTERHDSELQLQELRAQLFQAQKLEALGQLTGGMAHDFNNLLTVIIGASALAARTQDPKRLKELLGSIHEAGLRGSHLTQHLLSFARQRDQQQQLVELENTLHSAQMFFTQALPKGMSLELQLCPPLHPILVDPSQLEMALLNLIFNARDAMQESGTIVLRAENRHLQGEWENLHGDFVLLTVRDDGVGIAPEILPRIFEPFFTTKGLGKGTGLGLSQAYGFIRQQGGTIRVDSTPGAGTSVTLCLPARPREAH
jgi:PAS domain S-box-containing protein